MGSKGEHKEGHDRAGALGMGVVWDMRPSLSAAHVCGPICEYMSDCLTSQGPHAVSLPL